MHALACWERLKLTELAELAVGDDQRAERAKTLQCLVAVLLGCILVDRCAWGCGIATADLLGLPDEVLQHVAVVLGQEHVLCLLDDISKVCDQGLAFGRELGGRARDRLGRQKAVEGDVDLLVLLRVRRLGGGIAGGERRTHGWDLAILEGRDDAVQLELSVDVLLLLLDVRRSVDGRGRPGVDASARTRRTRMEEGESESEASSISTI